MRVLLNTTKYRPLEEPESIGMQSTLHSTSHFISASPNQSLHGWPDLSFDFSVSGIFNENDNIIQETSVKLEECKSYYCRSDDHKLLEVDIPATFNTHDCFVMTITILDPFIGQDSDDDGIEFINNLDISLKSVTQELVYYPLFHNSSIDNKEFIFTLCTSNNFHQGKYYLIINDHNISVRTDFKIIYHITTLLRDIGPLDEGKLIRDTIQANEWKYYRFQFHSNTNKVIQINTTIDRSYHASVTGDIDIYVSNKHNGLIPVNNKNYIWRNVTPGSSSIDIHPQLDKSTQVRILDPNRSSNFDNIYTIGIFGCSEACESCNYSITLSLTDPLPIHNMMEAVNSKQLHTIRLVADQYYYFKLPVQIHSPCRCIVNINVNNKDKIDPTLAESFANNSYGIYSTDSLFPLPSNLHTHDNICAKSLLFPVVYILDGNNSVVYASQNNYSYRASSIAGNISIVIEPLELLVASTGINKSTHELYLSIYGYDVSNSPANSTRSIICHINTTVEMKPVDDNNLLTKNDHHQGFFPSNDSSTKEFGPDAAHYCELDRDILYGILNAVTISPGLIVYDIYCGTGRNIISLALNNTVHFFKCVGVEFDRNLSNKATESISKLRSLAKDLSITLPLIDVVHAPAFNYSDLAEGNVILFLNAFLLDDAVFTDLFHNILSNVKRGSMIITTKCINSSIAFQLIHKQKFRLENHCGTTNLYYLSKM